MRWIVLLLLVACAQQATFSQQENTQLMQTYHEHLHNLSIIIAQQQEFADAIQSNYDNATLHQQQINAYLLWSNNTKQQLQEIKTFIEQHYVELLKTGKDPIAIRDLTKLMFESELRNEEFFERCDSIWQHYNA